MKINSIIDRYVFAEMITPFGISLIFLTFIFLMSQILDITDLVVNHQVGLLPVCALMLFSMPEFLGFTIPMSVMLAVLLTFLRMSADHEIIALKAGGISIYRLLPPVLMFALLGCILTAVMTVSGTAWGKLAFKHKVLEVAADNIDIGLKERTFNDSFQGVMLYVSKIDIRDRSLIDVFIHDERSARRAATVVAPRGRLFMEDDRNSFTLRLYQGRINQVDLENKTVNAVDFDTYDIHLQLEPTDLAAKDDDRDPDEMTMAELRSLHRELPAGHKTKRAIGIEIHKRLSIPFACFTLGLLAAALGLQSTSAGRSAGPGLGIAFFVLYYLLLTTGSSLSKTGYCPPVMGMWLPNVVFGALGIFLLIRTSKECCLQLNGRLDPLRRVYRFLAHLRG
jgi:lipopolysaccharide export system permease protein